jgi:predicted transcriptional regulator
MIHISQNIKKTLKESDFSLAEQQVIVLLIQKKLLTIQEITQELKLPRSSVQLACESLLETGVCKVEKKGTRRLFYIEHPKDVRNFLTFSEKKLEQKKLALDLIVPELLNIYTQHKDIELIDIERLEGPEGFIEVFNRGLEQPKNGEILRFGGDEKRFTVARDILKKNREERVKKKIFVRMIVPFSESLEFEKIDALSKFREIRSLPIELYNPDVNISLWGDTTAITIWDAGLHTIIIKNKAVNNFYRQIFELLWGIAK